IDSLAHVDLGAAGWRDVVAMWRAAYRLLEWRDALGAAPRAANTRPPARPAPRKAIDNGHPLPI
ncbi:MAG: hypothetical protein IRY94_12760, partial [Rhodospirillaceae bacterium]|nr:hypothetical protein [Rhodospirillaceae bacterium]